MTLTLDLAVAADRDWAALYGIEYGDPRLPDRWWVKVYPCPITGCWLWGAAQLRGAGDQYRPSYQHDGRTQLGHRVAWTMLVGSIPDGLTLDHLCRTPLCVRPLHLEPVTGAINALRGTSPWAANARKDVCDAGHEFTPENTYIDVRGSRICRACKRDWARAAAGVDETTVRPIAALRTHCPAEHEYTPENTRINARGSRECIECERRRGREKYQRKKASKAVMQVA